MSKNTYYGIGVAKNHPTYNFIKARIGRPAGTIEIQASCVEQDKAVLDLLYNSSYAYHDCELAYVRDAAVSFLNRRCRQDMKKGGRYQYTLSIAAYYRPSDQSVFFGVRQVGCVTKI